MSENNEGEGKVPEGVFKGIEDINTGNTASMNDLKEVVDKNE
jgi:hypothetical protein